MKTGEKVIAIYTDIAYNSNRKKERRIDGTFLKDYGNYIQILDKYKLRRSIMKNDLIKIRYA